MAGLASAPVIVTELMKLLCEFGGFVEFGWLDILARCCGTGYVAYRTRNLEGFMRLLSLTCFVMFKTRCEWPHWLAFTIWPKGILYSNQNGV